jgi:hypothetical protein
MYTYLPMKMEQCSETSAYKIQTPWNYTEESIQQTSNYRTEKIWPLIISSPTEVNTCSLNRLQSYASFLKSILKAGSSDPTHHLMLLTNL